LSFELHDLGGVSTLFVMATEAEYGPALRALIRPLMVGVGPVEAAAGTAVALAGLQAAVPDLVVSLGSAGSPGLDHAAVYQVASVSYRDMDASPLGFAKGQVPFSDVPPVIEISHRIDGIPTASLSTGANIVSGAAYADIDAEMVDMETYAVLRAAAMFGVPTIGLRGISDGRSELAKLEDWSATLGIIDRHLADAIVFLERSAASFTIRR